MEKRWDELVAGPFQYLTAPQILWWQGGRGRGDVRDKVTCLKGPESTAAIEGTDE